MVWAEIMRNHEKSIEILIINLLDSLEIIEMLNHPRETRPNILNRSRKIMIEVTEIMDAHRTYQKIMAITGIIGGWGGPLKS